MSAPAAAPVRCRLCTGGLDEGADLKHRLCSNCKARPEGRAIIARANTGAAAAAALKPPTKARSFTLADRALIKSLHRTLPARELLQILNLRLEADLGPDARAYSLEQLQEEIARIAGPRDASDWGGLRRLLREARLAGVLGQVAASTIDDFAIVFGLSPAQVVHLKDVVLSAKEDR